MTGFWKVFGAAALVVAVAVGLVGFLALRTLGDAVDEHLSRRVEGETALLAAAVLPALRAGDMSGLDPQVHALAARLPGDRLTVIAADGRVLADSQGDASLMENHADREELRNALHPGARPIVRTSRTLHEEMVYFALPVQDGARLLGYARLAVPEADVRADRARLSRAVLWAALLALLVGAAAAVLLARSVRRPLREISRTVQAIARGEPTAPLAPVTSGELAGLARAVDEMAGQLRERFERIARDQSEIRAIVGAMVEGVLAIDAGSRVVLLNAAGASLLGTTPEAARGRPLLEVTRLPEITELLARCLRTGEPAWAELRVAGETRDRVLRLAASPLQDARGAFGAVVVLHDLTEVRRLESVRRDFVVNVSHELKTPLTAMRGFLDAVLEDREMPPELRSRFLGRARDATDRLAAMVGDLLTLARIEADEGTLRRTPLDLAELAAEACAASSDAAALRGTRLQLDTPPEPVPVLGDRAELVTALGNLIDNAVAYGPDGGEVRVRVLRPDEEAQVEVQDDGPGIPPHEQQRIWERFYRVDKSRSRDLGGTGLGLSIVRNVAAAHGGRVSLDSELGRGSTFRLHLPAASPASFSAGTGAPDAV
jgi:two-component system phosphate regulon sensor histidine kinase PhoR